MASARGLCWPMMGAAIGLDMGDDLRRRVATAAHQIDQRVGGVGRPPLALHQRGGSPHRVDDREGTLGR